MSLQNVLPAPECFSVQCALCQDLLAQLVRKPPTNQITVSQPIRQTIRHAQALFCRTRIWCIRSSPLGPSMKTVRNTAARSEAELSFVLCRRCYVVAYQRAARSRHRRRQVSATVIRSLELLPKAVPGEYQTFVSRFASITCSGQCLSPGGKVTFQFGTVQRVYRRQRPHSRASHEKDQFHFHHLRSRKTALSVCAYVVLPTQIQ